jgi:hypothetical protein
MINSFLQHLESVFRGLRLGMRVNLDVCDIRS